MPRGSKSEQAYEILKARIMDGTFGPGSRLVIDQLGREHNISSVPWRESLRKLEAEGWVRIVPNVGAFVKTVDTASWHRTMRLLSRLEGLATALSAPRLDAQELATARQLNKDMGAALADFDTARFGTLNREFHVLLCSKAEDARLLELVRGEWTRLDLIRRSAFWYAPGRAVASLTEHDQILDLISGGVDAELIESAVRKHEMNTLDAVAEYKKAEEQKRSAAS